VEPELRVNRWARVLLVMGVYILAISLAGIAHATLPPLGPSWPVWWVITAVSLACLAAAFCLPVAIGVLAEASKVNRWARCSAWVALFACFSLVMWGGVQILTADEEVFKSRNLMYACIENQRELAVAALMYADDHGGRLPPAQEWCDLLRPYLKDAHAFVCPAARNLRCSYAFNANLSGVRLDDSPESRHVVIFFESDRGWNAAGGPELLPAQPRHRFGEMDISIVGNRQGLVTSSSSSRYRLVETEQWQPQPQAAREATH